MNYLIKATKLLAILGLTSCTVTNNIYINDPVPVSKGNIDIQIGIGTGHKAKTDSVADNGDIYFSDKLELAPTIFTSGQYGITDQLNLRYSLHLPYIVGGIGLRAGIQYSFFPKQTKFNAAIGTDFGFVIAKDSIKILGSKSDLDTYTNGAINGDVFLPVSYNFNKDYRIVLTARYSFNALYVKQNMYNDNANAFTPQLPSIALGLRLNKIYLEGNVSRYNDLYIPNFGLIYIFNINNTE